MPSSMVERVLGALHGVAVGDALGIPAGHYSPEEIPIVYGGRITGLVQQIRRFGSVPPKWRLGEVSDDTVQTLAVAEAVAGAGSVQRIEVGRRLLALPNRYCNSTTSCGKFRAYGDPNAVAVGGGGNGAAMRISPVGIVTPLQHIELLIHDVVAVSTLTHNTPVALAGAIAVAAAVSAAVAGQTGPQIVDSALMAVEHFEAFLNSGPPLMSVEIRRAVKLGPQGWVDSLGLGGAWGYVAEQSVPCVLALTACELRPKDALLAAVNLGGDADSIASMVGAIAGASWPDSIPTAWVELVVGVNGLDCQPLAAALARLRRERTPLGAPRMMSN